MVESYTGPVSPENRLKEITYQHPCVDSLSTPHQCTNSAHPPSRVRTELLLPGLGIQTAPNPDPRHPQQPPALTSPTNPVPLPSRLRFSATPHETDRFSLEPAALTTNKSHESPAFYTSPYELSTDTSTRLSLPSTSSSSSVSSSDDLAAGPPHKQVPLRGQKGALIGTFFLSTCFIQSSCGWVRRLVSARKRDLRDPFFFRLFYPPFSFDLFYLCLGAR